MKHKKKILSFMIYVWMAVCLFFYLNNFPNIINILMNKITPN